MTPSILQSRTGRAVESARPGGVGRRGGSRAVWAVAVLVAACYLAPAFLTSVFQLQVLTVTFLNAALTVGAVLALGYAGLLTLSHGTLYGVGAYITASLITDHGVPFPVAFLLAGVGGAVGGLVLGMASKRVRGDYFALVSLAFTIAVYELMLHWDAVTHGASGFFGIPVTSLFGVQLSGFSAGYYTCLVLLTLTTLFVWRFSRTFAARAMLAVRFDDFAAESMGINAFFTRQLAMALSGALAGFAGAILVATAVFVAPGNFNLLASFNIGLWVIIGGMASIPGAIAAGGLITLLTEEFRFLSHVSVGLLGVLVLIAVYTRGGVLSDLVADRVARRHGRRLTSEAPRA